eukprot:s2777_g4.t1
MAFAALKRLGQALLGNDTLRKVQQHLERDEGALAWQLACSESWNSAEGLATAAVAAASCGLWDEAAEILQRVESLPSVSVEARGFRCGEVLPWHSLPFERYLPHLRATTSSQDPV